MPEKLSAVEVTFSVSALFTYSGLFIFKWPHIKSRCYQQSYCRYCVKTWKDKYFPYHTSTEQIKIEKYLGPFNIGQREDSKACYRRDSTSGENMMSCPMRRAGLCMWDMSTHMHLHNDFKVSYDAKLLHKISRGSNVVQMNLHSDTVYPVLNALWSWDELIPLHCQSLTLKLLLL